MASNSSLPMKNQFDPGDVAWVLASMALVFLMMPGLAFFYGGMARTKHALSLVLSVILCAAVVSIQWWIWGYSLAFSTNIKDHAFIGNLDHAFFMNVLDEADPAPRVPRLLFALFQGMFACITPALAIGAAAERGRIVPMIIFTFIWSTLVYDVLACWIWNPKGWCQMLGVLDFAGGTPVEISSGVSGLAYIIIVGKRQGTIKEFRPHNIIHVVLGTGLLWFGWFGFNGGSVMGANSRAVMACAVTNLAGSSGVATWLMIDYIRGRRVSAFGFCSGAVAGLVASTPASGFVQLWAAFLLGMITSGVCYCACEFKHKFGFDDAVDVFGIHAVGGFCGNLLTAIFADARIVALDDQASMIPGGWINGNWVQLGYNAAASIAGALYSFIVTLIILLIMNRIPGLSLRANADNEAMGLDSAELGELAYQFMQQYGLAVRTPSIRLRKQIECAVVSDGKPTKIDQISLQVPEFTPQLRIRANTDAGVVLSVMKAKKAYQSNEKIDVKGDKY